MIAESKPDERETTLKVIVNYINKRGLMKQEDSNVHKAQVIQTTFSGARCSVTKMTSREYGRLHNRMQAIDDSGCVSTPAQTLRTVYPRVTPAHLIDKDFLLVEHDSLLDSVSKECFSLSKNLGSQHFIHLHFVVQLFGHFWREFDILDLEEWMSGLRTAVSRALCDC